MATVAVAPTIPGQASDEVGRGGSLESLRCPGDQFEWRNGVGSSSVGFSMAAHVGRCDLSVRGRRSSRGWSRRGRTGALRWHGARGHLGGAGEWPELPVCVEALSVVGAGTRVWVLLGGRWRGVRARLREDLRGTGAEDSTTGLGLESNV
jgi:hypothetical protein